MSQVLMALAIIILVGHGLVHVVGIAAYMRLGDFRDMPLKATLIEGRWNLGHRGIRVFGALWMVPAVGFLAAAVALAEGWPWWPAVLLASTLVSLVLTSLDWQYAFFGTIVNVAILGLLAVRALR